MEQRETERVDEDTPSENPEDVAVLYSWAKLQGAKYRDFSASRRAYRAQMRHRAAEVQRESERRAQLEAEATASATERAAREAEDVARFHDSAARKAALEAKQRESVVEEAASARAMRTASELGRRAAMERLEAARRAEAVAAAEAAARREELEIAEAHVSAQRQARQYYESDARRKIASGQKPEKMGGEISDPYITEAVATRTDRMSHQLEAPEEDMQPMRYRQSRDTGRYSVVQPHPAHPLDPDAPLDYLAAGPSSRDADTATAAMAANDSAVQIHPARTTEPVKSSDRRSKGQAGEGQTSFTPTGQERRVYEQRAHDRESQTTEREPWFPERIQMSREPEEMSPERSSYASGSEAMREAYAARVAAAPPAGRRNSGIRVPVGSEPDALAESRGHAEPRADLPIEPNALSMVEIDGVLRPDRRAKPRPDFSNLPLRDYRPEAANGHADEPDHAVPAWIYGDTPRPESKRPSAPSSPVEDTLQHTRERVASRWFALKGVFDQGGPEPQQGQQRAKEMRAPLVTVFSLAGGVGKTSLVATLGRALSSTGERVLLTDTTSHGLLPFYFGASELRPGAVRTFSPPSGSSDAPIYLVSYDMNQQAGDAASQDWLGEELSKNSRNMQRVLVDLTPGAAWIARRLARMNSTILVPVAPDMNSVISLAGVEKFFAGMADADGRPVQPFYVLNQFDASLPLHLDVREVMRQQLGERLLPFAIRRSPAVSEALAEGMTVIDYAPDSAVSGDYMNLVSWLRAQAAPAVADFRSARWSERSDR